MKWTNHLGPRVVVVTILFFLSIVAVSAQSLDGKWFKLQVQAHSLRVDPATGHRTPYDFTFKAYVHFTYMSSNPPRGAVYHCEVWSQSSPGNWVVSTSSDRTTPSFSENFTQDWNIQFLTQQGVTVRTYVTPFFCVFPNLFQAGGEIYTGEDSQGNSIFGWLTITGGLTTTLPFSPD